MKKTALSCSSLIARNYLGDVLFNWLALISQLLSIFNIAHDENILAINGIAFPNVAM